MEYTWNIETALQEIKEGLISLDKRVIVVAEEKSSLNPCLLFSHGSKFMSATFLGASWRIEFPVRLRVKVNTKLYKSLIEDSSLNGIGTWELGIIESASKEANLLVSKHFWYPPTIETVAFIQNVGNYHKSDQDDDLGGIAVASHASYKTLEFHRTFFTYEMNS
jgi:hypothetical protein